MTHDHAPDETTIEPNPERDDTDGGMSAGADTAITGDEQRGDEVLDLDDELDAMSDDPGDDGNPLLQQNL